MSVTGEGSQPLPSGAQRWQPGVAFALVMAVLVLVPKPASSEPLTAPASFDARVAAIDPPDRVNDVPAKGSFEAPKIADDSTVRRETQVPRVLDARANYRALIEKEAAREGLAPQIAEAVMAVESGYNPGAIGTAGEIGLMQILPSTARMLGFSGTLADLAVPDTNIHYGVTYLAQAWRLAGGDLCTAVMKYRAGHGETRFSFLSVNYCLAVRSKLAARGFPVTGSVPVATFGEPGRSCSRKCLGGARVGHVDLAALNTRLTALVVQVRGGR
jgi:soluble lytic murein transglycosylase-like protein